VRVELTASEIRAAVKAALAEDIGGGDVTTLATVPKALTFVTVLRAREPLVVAGLDFAKAAFHRLSWSVKTENLVHDGTHVARGENLLRVSGSARAILSAERVALNFVQHLSGIATLTAQFDTLEQVAQAADAGADIILLDNMTVEQMRQAVKIAKGHAKTEASGGVELGTVRAIAGSGVDFISVGALTHSARAVDIGLDFTSK